MRRTLLTLVVVAATLSRRGCCGPRRSAQLHVLPARRPLPRRPGHRGDRCSGRSHDLLHGFHRGRGLEDEQRRRQLAQCDRFGARARPRRRSAESWVRSIPNSSRRASSDHRQRDMSQGPRREHRAGDAFGSASIGAVAVAASDPNIVWAGTGSACPRGNISSGDGVYKSTDAGDTWRHMGLDEAGQIGRVIVHPTDAGCRLCRRPGKHLRRE